MELNNILIIMIGVVSVYLIYNNLIINRHEGFYTSNTIRQHKAFSIFNDSQLGNTKYYENDNILKNTIYYENDDRGATGNKGLLTGWEKCRLSCPSNCVEYGLSGNAWCFDPNAENYKNNGDYFSGKAKYQQENTNKTDKEGDKVSSL